MDFVHPQAHIDDNAIRRQTAGGASIIIKIVGDFYPNVQLVCFEDEALRPGENALSASPHASIPSPVCGWPEAALYLILRIHDRARGRPRSRKALLPAPHGRPADADALRHRCAECRSAEGFALQTASVTYTSVCERMKADRRVKRRAGR